LFKYQVRPVGNKPKGLGAGFQELKHAKAYAQKLADEHGAQVEIIEL
jgi:hypothetical protein